MKLARSQFLAIVAFAFLVNLTVASRGASSVEDVMRILDERGIAVDKDAARQSAVDAMLKTIDPRARLIVMKDEPDKDKPLEVVASTEEWSDGICYLKLKGMHEGGIEKVTGKIREWTKAKKSGLILDIRGAGGVNLKAVEAIASAFCEEGDVLFLIRDSEGEILETHQKKKASSDDAEEIGSIPMMLLVDEKTTDESELFAAVMKDRAGVMLVGARTKGDAGLRESISLSDKESIYLTTRWLVLPEGVEYHSVGVVPDVIVNQDNKSNALEIPERDGAGRSLSEHMKKKKALMNKVSGDVTLGRATDILLGLGALKTKSNERQ